LTVPTLTNSSVAIRRLDLRAAALE
jgi:hypothetical protein